MTNALSGEARFVDGGTTDWVNLYLSRLVSELVEKRKEKRISQTELANMTGMLQPGIARLEKAAKPSASRYKSPNLDTMLRVANALGYTLCLVPIEDRPKRFTDSPLRDQKIS